LRAAGALLCHDAERDRALSDPIEIQKKRKEDYIRIEPHTNYGRPGPLAHKIFVAFIKKHSDYGRPVQSDVSFTKRELMRLVGRIAKSFREHYTKSAEPRSPHFSIPTIDTLNAISISQRALF
jgi:hypothetical protein